MDDKLKHSAEGGLGKAKEKLGDVTDDPSLEAEGKKDQSKSDLKQAGDKVKDAFNE
ncbi:MAG: CsbD family protein [Nocardioidaceae bacterium]